MLILIDGYNLLHASTIVPRADRQGSLAQTRAAVLDYLVARLPLAWAQQTTVVFDKGTERGLPAKTQHGPLTIQFAVQHAEADDLLEQLIRDHDAPRRLTVVSSDHRVQRAARRRRARAVDSEVWLREIQQSTASPRPDVPCRDADQVDDWLREFDDIDVTALQREVESQLDDAPPKPATNSGGLVQKNEGAATFPGEFADDVLRDAELQERLDEDEPLFPEGYGEDLLEDEGNHP